jgi:glycosyltransferase involved in cell wall biosynthesis
MQNFSQQETEIKKTITASEALFSHEIAQAENLLKSGHTDSALQMAQRLSTYAWVNFTSYYTSYRLEKLIAEIGKKTVKSKNTPAPEKKNSKRRILHVASELYELGGHTPLLLKWMQRDKTSDHSLFLTRQSVVNIPVKIFAQHGIEKQAIVWSNTTDVPHIEVAQQLLDLSRDYDLLIFHIHPDDIVPLLAFSTEKPRPIYFLNHADHCFWLGASIIDGVIQLRNNTIALDQKRRSLDELKQFLLPIPIDKHIGTEYSKTETLKNYGIKPKFSKFLLTTSTINKFEPFLSYNYFDSVIPVLDKNPDTLLLIVGVAEDSNLALRYSHPQIKYLGYLYPDKLKEIEYLADIYLETFPYSSFTALLQVLMSKKPVHFMYAPPDVFRLFDMNDLYPQNQEAWQQALNKLLKDEKALEEYKEKLLKPVLEMYSEETWSKLLNSFYGYTDKTERALPVYKEDRSYNESINELFLYGTSQKIQYQYLFFENDKGSIRFNRAMNYLKLYLKLGETRSTLMSFGGKFIIKKMLKTGSHMVFGKNIFAKQA